MNLIIARATHSHTCTVCALHPLQSEKKLRKAMTLGSMRVFGTPLPGRRMRMEGWRAKSDEFLEVGDEAKLWPVAVLIRVRLGMYKSVAFC